MNLPLSLADSGIRQFPGWAATTLVGLLALAWSSLAFCDRIQGAARASDFAMPSVSGDLGKVKALLKDNPDLVFSKDDQGMTPLHWVAQLGCKDAAELLLASKAEVNAKNNDGWTPLLEAAFWGNRDVAELLLAHGADVNGKSN